MLNDCFMLNRQYKLGSQRAICFLAFVRHVAKFASVLTPPVQLKKSCQTELFTVKTHECPENLNLET